MPVHNFPRLTLIWLLVSILLASCAPQAATPEPLQAPPGPPRRIALLAPFEGRFRDIGYDALYAARLALADVGIGNIELVPIDDGGDPSLAVERAGALTGDPQVYAALLIGYAASGNETQGALGDIPMLIVGDWGAQPVGASALILGLGRVGLPDDSYFFQSIRDTHEDRGEGDFPSAAALPDADFVRRYAEIDQFAQPPTPLATLTYDATRILIESVARGSDRATAAEQIAGTQYNGINGPIRFIAHTWINPPQRLYRVQGGALTLLDDNTMN
jgi:ABC-type branched-subunit amino acid transport system substrate-binding protein